MKATFQETRYRNLGLKLFERQDSLILEKAYLLISLDQQMELLRTGHSTAIKGNAADLLALLDRVMQGFRHRDYELVIPSKAEKSQIEKDGIALHGSVIKVVIECLEASVATAVVSSHRWEMLASSLQKGLIMIVKTM